VSPFLSALFAKLVPASIVGKIAVGAVAVAAVAGGGTAAGEAVASPDTTAVSSVTPAISPSPTEAPEQGTEAITDAESIETEASTPDAVASDTSTDVADSESADTPEVTHPANHGGDVSTVARGTFDSGREHGQAVSEAAHQHGDDSDAAETEDESGPEDATANPPGNSGGHGHR